MAFEQVFGQDKMKAFFLSAIRQERLAHAYLFFGQAGVGKDAMAVGLGLALNCEDAEKEGCGGCPACRRILRLEHPAFRFMLPVPARPKAMKIERYQEIIRERYLARVDNPYLPVSFSPEISTLPVIGIDQIRQLKQETRLRIAKGARVIVLSHAEEMTVSAANSLLKLLEEPPFGTYLVLTTENPSRILPTILSRCQMLRFPPLDEETVCRALETRWGMETQKAKLLSRLSGGSIQKALDFLDSEFEDRREAAFRFLEACCRGRRLQVFTETDHLLNRWDKNGFLTWLVILQGLLRDLMHLDAAADQRLIHADMGSRLRGLSGHWSGRGLESALRHTEQAIDLIGKNVYLNIIMHELGSALMRCRSETAERIHHG
ncbi:hypothetical protein JW906_05985 [bacterium]|nr:hypothetical protein [bacterium]